MRTRRHTRNTAFTLLELTLVLLVLAIVIGMATPSLSGSRRSRQLRDAATHFVGMARWARTHAAVEGRPFRLNVDPRNGTYWLTAELPEGGFAELADDEMGEVFEVPEDFTIAWDGPSRPDGQYVTFFPSGRTEAAFNAPAVDGAADLGTIARAGSFRFLAPNGAAAEIVCPSATEEFRILPAATADGGIR